MTEHWATIALSGPKARAVLEAMAPSFPVDPATFPFMSPPRRHGWRDCRRGSFASASPASSSYEVNVPATHGRQLWEAAIEAGRAHGITPYGTEAMHVLRAEKGFIIVGQETDGSVTPPDLGMGRMVSKKKEFIGRRSLRRAALVDPERKQLVGLLPKDPNTVLPEGAQLVRALQPKPPMAMVGHVTSSYFGARIGRSFGLALGEGRPGASRRDAAGAARRPRHRGGDRGAALLRSRREAPRWLRQRRSTRYPRWRWSISAAIPAMPPLLPRSRA